MLVKSVSAVLAWINSPLAYPFRCLSGGKLRILAGRLARARRLAGDIVRINLRPGLPVRMQVETTDHCNLKCIMCTREVLAGMNSSALSFEMFRQIIDQAAPFYVTLNGLGEPLLDKTIFEKLKMLHQKKIMTSMPSNGTYMRREKLDKLAENLPDILQLSIDGATKESFEGIRKMGNFDSIVEGYRAVATRRVNGETRPGTSIRILCALQKKNLFDFRKMYRLFKSLPDVTFSLVPVFQFDAEGEHFRDVVPDAADVHRLHAEIDVAIDEAAGEEADFYRSWKKAAEPWLVAKKDNGPPVHTGSCAIPWYSTYIDAKGRVYPCCYLTETDHVMGNVNDRRFPEIWHGERYQDFRRRLVRDRANLAGCRTCPRNDHRLLHTLGRLRPVLGRALPSHETVTEAQLQ